MRRSQKKNSKLLRRSVHEAKQRAVKNHVLQNKRTQKRSRFCLAQLYPLCYTDTPLNGFTVLRWRFSHSILQQLVLPSSYTSGLFYWQAVPGSYTCQQRCPTALCSHGQTTSSYPVLPKMKFLFPDPTSPPHASTTILCSVGRASSLQPAVLRGHIITFVAKTSQRTARMHLSKTGENTHLLYQHLLLLENWDLPTAWSPLWSEESNYKVDMLRKRKK